MKNAEVPRGCTGASSPLGSNVPGAPLPVLHVTLAGPRFLAVRTIDWLGTDGERVALTVPVPVRVPRLSEMGGT